MKLKKSKNSEIKKPIIWENEEIEKVEKLNYFLIK